MVWVCSEWSHRRGKKSVAVAVAYIVKGVGYLKTPSVYETQVALEEDPKKGLYFDEN